MAVIRRFNQYCKQLEELYDPAYAIPLPSPLPTKLAELHGDSTLLQDVWVALSVGETPRWLEDAAVRNGIHTQSLRNDLIDIPTISSIVKDDAARQVRLPTDGFPQLAFDPKDMRLIDFAKY
ncbi:hypothetical protein PISMIDRAFT_10884 [Pisolithus microcarpus 441]|uniref:Uncharacterized protein n=1 Tax=Pisolithus microcarpus 441 TaxID=765257 RepID=A0A0C9YES7_9AGAM|nr:hypothetical protein PISMIDRAFT_10884 [Pisolithus microcarpus 441]